MKKNETICVLGLGYIGLPTACFLASSGYQVIGVDKKREKVKLLKKSRLPFSEPGLNKLFKKARKNLEFSLKPKPADIFLICVPTPITKNKKVDLKYVIQAAKDINKVIRNENLVIIESTVPPGTGEKIVLPLLKGKKYFDVYLSHAPERAIPGKTLLEMVNNNRIIGGIDEHSVFLTKEIYSSFVKGKLYLTDINTAEFVKIIENSSRDLNIAFANELAKLCDGLKINVWEARKLANFHPRVNILSPGAGVGGHCLSVDPWFLVRGGIAGTKMIKTSRLINDSMPYYVIESVSKLLKGIKNPKITILGVAYKANVDDWRETPALKVIEIMKKNKWQFQIHDPYVKDFSYEIERNFQKAVKSSDCLLLLTDHNFYKQLKPEKLKGMRHKIIFDSRNAIDKEKWQKSGFKVKILGDGY